MTTELTIKMSALISISVVMLAFSYFFYQDGESIIPLILLFIGIISALSLIRLAYTPKKRR
jgi:hypothetical protein